MKLTNQNLFTKYDQIKENLFNTEVTICGWIKSIRQQSTMFFITL